MVSVLEHAVKVDQLRIGIVYAFHSAGWLGKENGCATYKRLNIKVVRGNTRQNVANKLLFATIITDWGSN
jgi:hypothetical protein